jgi:hypothetical protein
LKSLDPGLPLAARLNWASEGQLMAIKQLPYSAPQHYKKPSVTARLLVAKPYIQSPADFIICDTCEAD